MGIQCHFVSSNTSTGLVANINTFLDSINNDGSIATIDYVEVWEGSIGGSSMKALIFYSQDANKFVTRP